MPTPVGTASSRSLRIDLGPDMPNDRNVDLFVWQEQQSRQQAQQFAVECLSLTMQALTVKERQFLMTFDALDHDVSASAQALRMSAIDAHILMEKIRNVAKRAAELVNA